jgi:hypothetical protein
MTFLVKVENQLTEARRDIHVLRKSREETLDEQRISCPAYEDGNVKGEEEKSLVGLHLGVADGEDDYVEISVDDKQSNLGPCKIELSPVVPFRFIPGGTVSLTVIPPEEGDTKTLLKIPSGLPTWKLEIMKPTRIVIPRGDDSGGTNVTVGDEPPGEGD